MKFGENGGKEINYVKMSEELGLHTYNITIMRATHAKINRLKLESRGLSGMNLFKTNNCQPHPPGFNH